MPSVCDKAVSSENVREGCATVCNGKRTQLHNNPQRVPEVEDIDEYNTVVVLNTRFLVAPSGWNS